VEDDAAIRGDTGEILRRAGHAVQGVADALAALELIQQQRFDVLMTDLGLPGMSGEELAVRALQRQPGLAVVVASGQNHLPPGQDDVVLLRKPYDSRQLLASLGQAVALRRS
jgi:CheY-like chemotaxis protein